MQNVAMFVAKALPITIGRKHDGLVTEENFIKLGEYKQISKKHLVIDYDKDCGEFYVEVFGKNGITLRKEFYKPREDIPERISIFSKDPIKIGPLCLYFLPAMRDRPKEPLEKLALKAYDHIVDNFKRAIDKAKSRTDSARKRPRDDDGESDDDKESKANENVILNGKKHLEDQLDYINQNGFEVDVIMNGIKQLYPYFRSHSTKPKKSQESSGAEKKYDPFRKNLQNSLRNGTSFYQVRFDDGTISYRKATEEEKLLKTNQKKDQREEKNRKRIEKE